MRKILLLICAVVSILSAEVAEAQAISEAIYFTDKNNSPYSTANPLVYLSPRSIARRLQQNIPVTVTDLPPNPSYVDSLRALGANVWYTSRWMNAAVIRNPSSALLTQINSLGFVASSQNLQRNAGSVGGEGKFKDKVKSNGSGARAAFDSTDYGTSFNQAAMLCVDSLHTMGFTGKGMMIAVLDNGFLNVNSISHFSHLFANNRIKATFDFGDNEVNVYNDASHGTNVLSCISAFQLGAIIGTAYEADLVLCRTEVNGSETPNEEMNWILGAEFADSTGADVINTSLGYYDFDPGFQDYTLAELDGQTALITRGANIASRTGMLLINSAGNEGTEAWKKILFPADSDSVLSIGAVDAGEVRVGFSSQGPTADGRIKPDLMAKGGSATIVYANGLIGIGHGTSFAGPIFAGMATSLWQALPGKTNFDMMGLLRQSGDRANQPDTLYGYGVPCAITVLDSIGFNYDSVRSSLPQPPVVTPPAFDFQILGSRNMVDGKIELKFEGLSRPTSAEVYITDMRGARVFYVKVADINGTVTINYPPISISEAMYLLTVKTETDVVSKKVFIK